MEQKFLTGKYQKNGLLKMLYIITPNGEKICDFKKNN